jgi:hypothetical protein
VEERDMANAAHATGQAHTPQRFIIDAEATEGTFGVHATPWEAALAATVAWSRQAGQA